MMVLGVRCMVGGGRREGSGSSGLKTNGVIKECFSENYYHRWRTWSYWFVTLDLEGKIRMNRTKNSDTSFLYSLFVVLVCTHTR